MISVDWSSKGKPFRAYVQGTAQRLTNVRSPAKDRQNCGEDKVGRLTKGMYGTEDASHIWQLDYVNLICGELGGFRRGRHSAALFHNLKQDVRLAVHGDDFVCLSGGDGLNHIDSLLKSKCTAKDMGKLGCEDSDAKRFLLLNCVFRFGADQTGQFLDVEVDLRHTIIIKDSGCNANTKIVSLHRVELPDKLVFDGRTSPILRKEDATRYRSACVRLSYLAQDRSYFAQTATHLAQMMSEPRDFDFVPPNLQYDSEGNNTLTKSLSLCTAISLATQSREKARWDRWHRLGTFQ